MITTQKTHGNQMKTSDNHTKKLPVKEYATLQNIGVTTVYRYIKAGKLEHEVIDGNTYVVFNENHTVTNRNQIVFNENHSYNDAPNNLLEKQEELVKQLQSENEHLRDQLRAQQTQVSQLTDQITDNNDARKRSDTIIMQLTQQLERTQMQLEDLRETKTLWQRMKSVFIPNSA